MGGCCCSAKGPELATPAGYNYCSRTSEEQVPMPANHGTTIVLSPGLLVDMNLDTSIPDTYRPPPPPAPYDVVLGHTQTPIEADKAAGYESSAAGKTANSCCIAGGDKTQDNSVKWEDLKLSDCKEQIDSDSDKGKGMETDPLKYVGPVIYAEECPICLEEYDADNPKIVTNCEHHFHLACLLEWLERSDTCPVCDEEMVFDPPTS